MILSNFPSEGYYYYVVVATDGVQNSTMSNRQFIVYELPHIAEYIISFGIVLVVSISIITLVYLKNKKYKKI